MRTHNRSKLAILAAIIVAAVAVSAQSSQVFKTKNGKRYHLYADCSSLKSSSNVQTIDRSTVGTLDLCKICERRQSKGGK